MDPTGPPPCDYDPPEAYDYDPPQPVEYDPCRLNGAGSRAESGAYRRVNSIFPVALLLNEPEDAENAANRAGYRFFTDAVDFQAYVEREILVVEEPV